MPLRIQPQKQIEAALATLLQRAVALAGAVKGTLQLFDPTDKTLRIVGELGFNSEFLDHFRVVNTLDGSACGRAAGSGRPVIIEDMMTDPAFEPHREIAQAAGVRSVMCTPIRDSHGELLGIVSVHAAFATNHWDPDALKPILGSLSSMLTQLRAARELGSRSS